MGSLTPASDDATGLVLDPLEPGWVSLEPGIYEVEVSFGPTFRASAFSEVDVEDPSVRGVVLRPSQDDLREWSSVMCSNVLDGRDCRGGWAPDRSAGVLWRGNDSPYYYKCGDAGAFDLAWQPPVAPYWTTYRDILYTEVLKDFYGMLTRERKFLSPTIVPVLPYLQELDAEISKYRSMLEARGVALG